MKRAVAACVAAMLAIAACGGDDDDAESTPEESAVTTAPATESSAETTEPSTESSTEATESSGSSAAPAAAPTGEPFKIGIAVGQTGFNALAQGPTVDVARAWAEWTNARGGIDGRPVELVVKDTQGISATAQAAVKGLVESDKVLAVMLMDAAGAGGVGDYPVQQNFAVVGIGSFNGGQWGALPNYFSVATDQQAGSRSYAVAAKLMGATSVGIMVCAEVAVCLDAGSKVEKQAAVEGIEYAGVLKAAAADPNYTAQCLTLLQNGADFIAMGLASETWLRAIPDCETQGYEGAFGIVTGSFNADTLDQLEGGVFAGGINTFPWWVDDPAVQEFRDAMDQYAPDTDIRGTWRTGAWSSLELLKKAVEDHAGVEATKEDVLAAMHSVKDENLGGLLPHAVTYTAGQPETNWPCIWMTKYEAGADSPELLEYETTDSNGATGPLQSQCLDPLPA